MLLCTRTALHTNPNGTPSSSQVLWYDVVVASGEVVRASPTENKELYYALPWSHGTLGFVVALELKLVRSKPYIKLEYAPSLSLSLSRARARSLSSPIMLPCVSYMRMLMLMHDGTLRLPSSRRLAPCAGICRLNPWKGTAKRSGNYRAQTRTRLTLSKPRSTAEKKQW